MRRFLFISVCILTAVCISFSTSFAFKKVGTVGFQFLKLGPTAGSVGMGEAVTATTGGVSSIFWNPAGLTKLNNFGVIGGYNQWIADINLMSAAAAVNLEGIGVVGISAKMLTTDDMPVTNVDNIAGTGEMFSYRDLIIGISFARSITDRFSVGGQISYVEESIWNDKATNIALDFGTQFDTGFKSLRLGMVIQNFGPDATFIKEEFPMPMIFKFGMAIDLLAQNGLFSGSGGDQHKITFSLDSVYPPDYEERVYAGAEYSLMDMIYLRGGYKFNFDEESFSVGAGVNLSLFNGKSVRCDVSYSDFGEYFTSPLRFTVGAEF